jgi:hypothetical protein
MNPVLIIVTNDDHFCNSGYRFYVGGGGNHVPDYKDEMCIQYRFLILTYTSL